MLHTKIESEDLPRWKRLDGGLILQGAGAGLQKRACRSGLAGAGLQEAWPGECESLGRKAANDVLDREKRYFQIRKIIPQGTILFGYDLYDSEVW